MSLQKYNALDNPEIARQFRKQLVLERDDIRASLSYEYATSWCSDCPRREREPSSYSDLEFPVHYAPACCKEDLAWEENHESDFKKDEQIEALIKTIGLYLGEEVGQKP